ncbi:MAG TPA: histidine kinase [Nocardioidaceae bacterium]|nr:histidine kinase [Nocardioidaceae bacterium]
MASLGTVSLYGRLFAANAVVFVVGTTALALSPATVSARVLASEALVLGVGLSALLVVNAVLLRAGLAPLERLARDMATVDPSVPGQRLAVTGPRPVSSLVTAYNDMVERLELERASSSARVLVGQERERYRVARELHDEVGQSLTVVLLGLQRCRDGAPAELDEQLGEVQESLRGALDEVRAVAQRLRPGVLEDLGLSSALAGLVTEFTKATGVHVRRSSSPGLPKLPHDVELVFYRVAQEALTNVARHASARTVSFSLTRRGGSLVLEVTDDGKGLNGAPRGVGLTGMAERATLVRGSLRVTSPQGRGVTVRLEVPVDG